MRHYDTVQQKCLYLMFVAKYLIYLLIALKQHADLQRRLSPLALLNSSQTASPRVTEYTQSTGVRSTLTI